MSIITGFFRNSGGDTIVEVLISITIISLILSGAYITSNSSLADIRTAQERIQAVGVAQQQVEVLRAQANSFASAPDSNYLPTGSPGFCFYYSGSTYTVVDAILNGSANPQCQFQSPINYTVNITSLGQTGLITNNQNLTTYSFQINVTWRSLSPSVPTNQLNLYYRVST